MAATHFLRLWPDSSQFTAATFLNRCNSTKSENINPDPIKWNAITGTGRTLIKGAITNNKQQITKGKASIFIGHNSAERGAARDYYSVRNLLFICISWSIHLFARFSYIRAVGCAFICLRFVIYSIIHPSTHPLTRSFVYVHLFCFGEYLLVARLIYSQHLFTYSPARSFAYPFIYFYTYSYLSVRSIYRRVCSFVAQPPSDSLNLN